MRICRDGARLTLRLIRVGFRRLLTLVPAVIYSCVYSLLLTLWVLIFFITKLTSPPTCKLTNKLTSNNDDTQITQLLREYFRTLKLDYVAKEFETKNLGSTPSITLAEPCTSVFT